MTLRARKRPSFIEPIRIFPENTELYFGPPKNGAWIRRVSRAAGRAITRKLNPYLRMSIETIRLCFTSNFKWTNAAVLQHSHFETRVC